MQPIRKRNKCNRLQNSPYFCVFKYARAVKRGWKQRARLRRDAKNTFFFSRLTRPLARFARVRLLRHALPISLLILRKKTDCFAVYKCNDQNHWKPFCLPNWRVSFWLWTSNWHRTREMCGWNLKITDQEIRIGKRKLTFQKLRYFFLQFWPWSFQKNEKKKFFIYSQS